MLYPFQKKALAALEGPSSKSHVICISATGTGKSRIYENAAAAPRRKTVLISPLVALVRQQRESLLRLGIQTKTAAGGDSQIPGRNESGIWILSPESLLIPQCQSVFESWRPDLLVVDECHCLWEWGGRFRPAFQAIPHLLRLPSLRRSLWLTATLQYDARCQLRDWLRPVVTEIGKFDLPSHLELTVRRISLENRASYLLRFLLPRKDPGIVFVTTRDASERVARLLAATGKKVQSYHAGKSKEERKNTEAQLLRNEVQVVVATSAFGMGMNYPHLGFIILWQPSTSLLSLVQKIGRVSRGGQATGTALVLWDAEDFKMMEWSVGGSERRRKEMLDLLLFLRNDSVCRKQQLQRYFDPNLVSEAPCGRCDVCRRKPDLAVDSSGIKD